MRVPSTTTPRSARCERSRWEGELLLRRQRCCRLVSDLLTGLCQQLVVLGRERFNQRFLELSFQLPEHRLFRRVREHQRRLIDARQPLEENECLCLGQRQRHLVTVHGPASSCSEWSRRHSTTAHTAAAVPAAGGDASFFRNGDRDSRESSDSEKSTTETTTTPADLTAARPRRIRRRPSAVVATPRSIHRAPTSSADTCRRD